MRLFVYLPFFILSIACNNKEKNDKPVGTDPYPTLEAQRAALASKPYATPVRLIDSLQLINDLKYLSSAACEGRKPGTAGHALARARILERLKATAVDSLGGSLIQSFSNSSINGSTEGLNVIGWVKGTTNPGKYLVVTAHYDHLGKEGSTIYYGADDNASGVACLLALAEYYKAHPLSYSIVFAALDREEVGFQGAYAAVDWLQAQLGNQALVFNLNMDMIARSDKGEIFVSGVKHFPDYAYVVNDVQPYTNVKVLMGHDGGSPGDDWTQQSDHAAFFAKQIPFLYVGVEDHPDYHKPTDTFERVNPSAYLENCNMILQMIKALRL
ncbi:MAG: M28 family peptidase [Chitinophagaceae bacterium]